MPPHSVGGSGRPRRLLPVASVAALTLIVVATPLSAASPFDGTWRVDPASIAHPRPEVFAIRDGVYTCASCTPPYALPADGAFHPVSGEPGFDAAAVRVVDATTIEQVHRLDGRTVRTETIAVAPGGTRATLRFTDTINAGVAPVTGRQALTRIAAGPAGAHATSGSWTPAAPAEVSDNGLTQTLRIDADRLTLATAEGFSYTARLDGTPAATHGDPTVDRVSVRRIDPHTLAETDSLGGATVARFTLTVSADGKRLDIRWHNEKTGHDGAMTAHRM